MHSFFFFYFSGALILSAILTVGLRNPVYCTLALLSALVHVAGLFVLLSAEFVAAIQIIIYAGAVLILYLFVLMLLNLKTEEKFLHRGYFVALIFGGLVLAELFAALLFSPLARRAAPIGGTGVLPGTRGNTESLGVLLFNDFLLQFEIVGIILLGGIIGALVLTKSVPDVELPRPGEAAARGIPDSPDKRDIEETVAVGDRP